MVEASDICEKVNLCNDLQNSIWFLKYLFIYFIFVCGGGYGQLH